MIKGRKEEVQEGGENGEYGELIVSVWERYESSGIYLSLVEYIDFVDGARVEEVAEKGDRALEEIMENTFDLNN